MDMAKKVWQAIKREFPGADNRKLRERIFTLAQETGQVMILNKSVAFTARGKASLHAIQAEIDS